MGGLGSIVGGLGSVLGGITGPLLNPLLGPVIGGLVDGLGNTYTNKKPAPGTPAPIVVSPGPYGPSVPYQPGSPYGPKFGGPQFGSPNPFPPRPVGESKPAGPAPYSSSDHTVSIRGINVPCRQYPDDYSPDPAKSILLSSPAKIDAVCWSASTPNTSRRGDEAGWLMTKANCFIKVEEVEEYRDYRRLLRPCTEVRHWVGTLMEQYSRKDCYYCPSISTCGSEDLGSPPYADLLCYTEGDNISGNSTWFKNRGRECYFPAGVFDTRGFLGTPGGRC